MGIAAQSLIESLPDHLSERTRALNDRPVNLKGEFVLYWMHHAVRGHDNPALDVAVFTADRLQLPLLVYQGLSGRHPYNSDRHHTFILEGARDVQRQLASRGVSYRFCLPAEPADSSPLMELTARAAVSLTEDLPAPPFPAWSRRLAGASPAAFWVVDTACILPMQAVKKAYARAFQFRQTTRHEYQKRLNKPYDNLHIRTAPFRGALDFDCIDLASADIAELCAGCRIDHTVGPVAHTQGGSQAGYERWALFMRKGLMNYARYRNDAAVEFPSGVSRMSAYLHHGHVSPFRIAREAAAHGGDGADKFLDEMLIWRELAHNFCFYHNHPDRLDALPEWARKTLDEHRQDFRRPVFDWETLARAKTGDPLWDAAQTSLLIHGELHNNIRMTWGKALLQWTRSPDEALRVMIDLNHRYALDGSDPNSYGGILWCLGLFDRPFQPEKKIIGSLRPRSTSAHAARLDLAKYTARVTQPAGSTQLRVGIIGAGISGLTAARTLSDHGHRVQVVDKARGPGGRAATRRTAPFAFDHGAQYFTARDERFNRLVQSWADAGIAGLWDGRIRVLHNGRFKTEQRQHRRYVGIPGMSAVGRHLAENLDINWRSHVKQIFREGGTYTLKDEADCLMGQFDVLVAAAPPAQSARLLAGHSPVVERLAGVCMEPCWAVMLAFSQPLGLDFDGAFINGSDLTWAARNSSKPGRDTAECWVLHASSAWSEAHLELDAGEVVRRLTASFCIAVDMMPVKPVFAEAHRWRYARAQNPITEGCLWDHRSMIGVCGDWCCGSRIEGAFLSGAAVAGRILSFLS